jgi:hypothetical protein
MGHHLALPVWPVSLVPPVSHVSRQRNYARTQGSTRPPYEERHKRAWRHHSMYADRKMAADVSRNGACPSFGSLTLPWSGFPG